MTRISAEILDDKCLIKVRAKSSAELEINDARRKDKAFAKVFDLGLSIIRSDSFY